MRRRGQDQTGGPESVRINRRDSIFCAAVINNLWSLVPGLKERTMKDGQEGGDTLTGQLACIAPILKDIHRKSEYVVFSLTIGNDGKFTYSVYTPPIGHKFFKDFNGFLTFLGKLQDEDIEIEIAKCQEQIADYEKQIEEGKIAVGNTKKRLKIIEARRDEA